MWMGGLGQSPTILPPWRPDTHCTCDPVGPRNGLNDFGIYRPHWESIPGQSNQFAMQYKVQRDVLKLFTFRTVSSSKGKSYLESHIPLHRKHTATKCSIPVCNAVWRVESVMYGKGGIGWHFFVFRIGVFKCVTAILFV